MNRITQDLIIKAISEGFEKVGQDFKKIQKSQNEAFDKKPAQGFGAQLKELAIPITAAIAAVAGLVQGAKALWATLKRGEDIADANAALIAFTGSGEQATQVINAIQDASDGMVSKFEAAGLAAKIFSAGLATTSKEAADLAGLAVKLGDAFGVDATQAISDFSNVLQTGAIKVLRNYGINITDVKERAIELRKENKNLTESQATLQAAMESARGVLKKLEDAGYEAGDATEQLSSAWDDFKDSMATWLINAAEPALEYLAKNLTAINDVDEAMRLLGATTVYHASNLASLNGEIITNNELLERANLLLAIGKEKYTALSDSVAKSGGSFRAATADMLRWMGIAEDLGGVDFPAPTDDEVGNVQAWVSSLNGLTSASEIKSVLDNLKFQMAGGGELTSMVDFVKGLKLTPEQAQEIYGALYVEAENISVTTGKITEEAAKADIEGTLGVPFAEAESSSSTILANLTSLQGMAVNASAVVEITAVGDTWVVELLGGGFTTTSKPGKGAGSNAERVRGGGLALQARGGRLDLSVDTLVGEEGPELIKNGVVLTAAETRARLRNGLIPAASFKAGSWEDVYQGAGGGSYSGPAPGGSQIRSPGTLPPGSSGGAGTSGAPGVGAPGNATMIQAAVNVSAAQGNANTAMVVGALSTQQARATADSSRNQIKELQDIKTAIEKLPPKLAREVAYELALRL